MQKASWQRIRGRRKWLLGIAALLVVLLGLTGCSTVGYYGQAIWGQTRILMARQSIDQLIAAPSTPEPLRERLCFVRDVRSFAVEQLSLPDHGFRTYAELDNGKPRAVVWNVVAAPELSIEPLVWCFPVAGCVAYRGYFSEKRARRFADDLAGQGYDVDVGGVSAYSTLGWFEDPLLWTVINNSDLQLAGLIFHELAHQVVYVDNDTRFNESFATAVEIAGLQRWLEAEGRSQELDAYLLAMERESEVTALILDYRTHLQELYQGALNDDAKRESKARLFEELKEAYSAELKTEWGVERFRWDGYFERPLNNARLVWIGAYHELVPGFQALLAQQGDDLPAFYEAVEKLAALSPEERTEQLRAEVSDEP